MKPRETVTRVQQFLPRCIAEILLLLHFREDDATSHWLFAGESNCRASKATRVSARTRGNDAFKNVSGSSADIRVTRHRGLWSRVYPSLSVSYSRHAAYLWIHKDFTTTRIITGIVGSSERQFRWIPEFDQRATFAIKPRFLVAPDDVEWYIWRLGWSSCCGVDFWRRYYGERISFRVNCAENVIPQSYTSFRVNGTHRGWYANLQFVFVVLFNGGLKIHRNISSQ